MPSHPFKIVSIFADVPSYYIFYFNENQIILTIYGLIFSLNVKYLSIGNIKQTAMILVPVSNYYYFVNTILIICSEFGVMLFKIHTL